MSSIVDADPVKGMIYNARAPLPKESNISPRSTTPSSRLFSMPPTLRSRQGRPSLRGLGPPMVYTIPELLGETAIYLDWPSLMGLAEVDRYSQIVAQREVRRRIRFLLAAFMPSNKLNEFFDLLARTNGAIVGSFARCLITLNSENLFPAIASTIDEYTWPAGLDIVTRPRYFEEWADWFDCMGYDSWSVHHPARAYKDTVHYFERATRFAFISGRNTGNVRCLGSQRLYEY